MKVNVKTNHPKQGRKGITFHRDNTPSHIANVKIAKISELGMKQMPNSPYSPDIALSEFFLFRYFKHKLKDAPTIQQMNICPQSRI
jgi:hypothetical protein